MKATHSLSTVGVSESLFFQCKCPVHHFVPERCSLFFIYRLTNVSPFIEDDQQPDIRVRIAGRTVDWNTLAASGVSEECKHYYFI
jgi:hypothetical protein